MRVGAVTHRGYGELVFQRFGPFWGWVSAADLGVTNLVTLITELIAVRVGMSFFGIPPIVAVVAGLGLVVFSVAGGRYWRWERVALGLAGFNLLFLVAAVFSHPDPGAIARPSPPGSPCRVAPCSSSCSWWPPTSAPPSRPGCSSSSRARSSTRA